MVRRLPAAVLACCLAGPALAQQPGPARCGGLFCDVYYANAPAPVPGQPAVLDPTHLPCRDFICGMFGGRTAETSPPVELPVAAEPPAEPMTKTAHRRHKAQRAVAAAEPSADVAKSEAAK